MTTHTPTIAAQSRAVAAEAATSLPAGARDAFVADQAELDARGVPAGVVAPGTVMPDADLLDVTGESTSLSRLRAGRPMVVVLYRGAWCPYCNVALRTYQAELVPALAERGIALVAVSPQKPDGSMSAVDIDELTFDVASDPGNQLAVALGVESQPSTESLAAQLSLGLDIKERNADGGTSLPMPTVVVVDAAGLIRWIDVHPNYTTRSEVPDILAAIDTIA